jgi:lipoprotein-anchoring transpeptidase ErfK/SrfK
MPVTLPLIDAFFFNDERFAEDLKSNLQLTDDQVSSLREIAREETVKLRETRYSDQSEYQGSTIAAAELAESRITAAIGEEKARQLSDFVLRRWQDSGGEFVSTASPTPGLSPTDSTMATPSPIPTVTPPISGFPTPTVPPTIKPGTALTAASSPHLTPADTRIIVNAPAHRMDVFENGQLVKSYQIGIGYPEFPIPTGMRRVTSIIFNPTWTPPDEPWVESSRKVKVGEKIEAGSKLNPLGVIKIPIGLPSLIHGGKSPIQLGKFSSHGCVGLTNKQVQDLAKTLADLGGIELTDAEVARHEKNRMKTESVKLNNPVPVELRYETIVIEDGKLHIYRDVYERGTNTEENLSAVLAAYDVSLDQLSPEERTSVEQAMAEMARGPGGNPTEATTAQEKEKQKQRNIERGRLTRVVKGQKEIVIEIASLAGKGYPAPEESGSRGVGESGSRKTEDRKQKTVDRRQ